jgi:hypothetical protein
MLKGRKVFVTAAPPSAEVGAAVPFRRRANSEAQKLERLGSDAAGQGPAAIAAKFRLKAMRKRLQVRHETDEAREILYQNVSPAIQLSSTSHPESGDAD